MLRSVAYVSRAACALSSQQLEALLLDAQRFNATVGVTGVLFFHDGTFFQYIEGPEAGIAATYRRIVDASSHELIDVLLATSITRRYFDAWHMGFCHTPQTTMQELANASWEQSMPITRDEFEGFEGLRLAVHYWNKWSAENWGSVPATAP